MLANVQLRGRTSTVGSLLITQSELRFGEIKTVAALVLFEVGDAAGLIANARLNDLLRDSFGLSWFRLLLTPKGTNQ